MILLNRKQAVVERLLLDRIPAGSDRVAILLARSTVVKATASKPGRIRTIAAPITISITGEPCGRPVDTSAHGAAASTIHWRTGSAAPAPASRHEPPAHDKSLAKPFADETRPGARSGTWTHQDRTALAVRTR